MKNDFFELVLDIMINVSVENRLNELYVLVVNEETSIE